MSISRSNYWHIGKEGRGTIEQAIMILREHRQSTESANSIETIPQAFSSVSRDFSKLLGFPLTSEPSPDMSILGLDGQFRVFIGISGEHDDSDTYVKVERINMVEGVRIWEEYIYYSGGDSRAYMRSLIPGAKREPVGSREVQEAVCLAMAREINKSVNSPENSPEALMQISAKEFFPELVRLAERKLLPKEDFGFVELRVLGSKDEMDCVVISHKNNNYELIGKPWFVGENGVISLGRYPVLSPKTNTNYHKAFLDMKAFVASLMQTQRQ